MRTLKQNNVGTTFFPLPSNALLIFSEIILVSLEGGKVVYERITTLLLDITIVHTRWVLTCTSMRFRGVRVGKD